MATLTEEQKLLVVLRLAAFISPSAVVKELKLNYGVETTLQQLSAYDPSNAAGRRLSKELKAEFADARKRYLSDLSDVPLAHQAGRVRLLGEIMSQAKSTGNLKMAMEAVEQAAKDMGGMFTRAPQLGHGPDGKDGGDKADADAAAAERSARADELLDELRTRRDQQNSARGAERVDSAQSQTDADTGAL